MANKREIFLRYIIDKLGFTDRLFRDEYLEAFSLSCKNYIGLCAIPGDEDVESLPPFYTYLPDLDHFVPSSFNILNALLYEYNLKKNKTIKYVRSSNKLISASDIANFIFCPASFSIGGTYQLPRNRLLEVGHKLHEKHQLNNLELETSFDDSFFMELLGFVPEEKTIKAAYINHENEFFFDDLKNSELIFIGHDGLRKRESFKNYEDGVVGQPDYIYKNKEGEIYVVEEKFRWRDWGASNFFFENHKAQLATYICFLKEFDIKYGYLLYWTYDFVGAEISYKECRVLKITRGEKVEKYIQKKKKELYDFIANGNRLFDTDSLNPKKCANCSHTMLCGHKTKRFKKITYPYSTEFLSLVFVPYPNELKKDDTT